MEIKKIREITKNFFKLEYDNFVLKLIKKLLIILKVLTLLFVAKNLYG